MIDMVRLIAVLFVVAIHSSARLTSVGSFTTYGWYRPLLDIGVPAFFAISGYLLANKEVDQMKNYAFKIFKMLISFSIVYLIYDFLIEFFRHTFFLQSFQNGLKEYFTNIFSVLERIDISSVFNGTFGKYHLWFLMALSISALILYGLRKWKLSPEIIFIISGVIFVITDLEAISGTGLFEYGGVPKGFLYLSMGYFIKKKDIKSSTWGLVISFLLFAAANYFTSSWGLIAVMMAVTIYFLMTVIKNHYGKRNITSKMGGKYSQYIYLLHPLVISLYSRIEELFNVTFVSNVYIETVIVFILAASIPILLYKPIQRFFTNPVERYLDGIF